MKKEFTPENRARIDFLLDKLEKMGRRPGPGLIWLYQLGDDSRIYWPSLRHDLDYALRRAGLNSAETSEVADKRFMDQIEVTESNEWDDFTNAAFALSVTGWGAKEWPVPADDGDEKQAAVTESILLLQILRLAGEM